jgi:cobalt-zinc-cadmium efflux system membrane fusion protein
MEGVMVMRNPFLSIRGLLDAPGRRRVLLFAAPLTLAVLCLLGYAATESAGATQSPKTTETQQPTDGSVQLTDSQLAMISVGAVSERPFPLEREAIGSIDFNEDMAAQVFPPYQGRIVKLFARVGDNVMQGQTLFTIESPDLIQAESNLIAAAGVLDLTTRALARARQLYELQGIAEKDLQQAISDQQTAEGALNAGRDAVSVFGKSAAEIEHLIKSRTIDPYLVVPSPITGRVTSRTAAPGDFVQPGNVPAPFAVADISRIWMNASVTEMDMPKVRKGQQVHVHVMAFPERMFEGQISTVGASVDPQLHRGMVRAEIDDPNHELLPGMFASFVIVTGSPEVAAAVPLEGVVREGDGTHTVWVTTDRHHFVKHTVRIGQQHAGYDQILEGLHSGDQVVTKGALFLDNLAGEGSS